jgi:hypothetical protein
LVSSFETKMSLLLPALVRLPPPAGLKLTVPVKLPVR